ncbi:cell division protein ZipA C-terminal FtsZ-binding domain-containing protein [Chitinolyticbacter meiyuanensis]|uniref:cell division protein ZipA C-terminal FtsZ-binding domain-containing protein n=1 Tax=Chitinolyticbacter meiyuanensis TaxID=682798 RepID=UPI0011E5A6C7|nr:cell division protein ZipA C-terminal FtsZ-binding domain-containing protein [Chitinolyticbacter meiyuanensis]
MTDLQLGSLIAAGGIVAAVYAFNWWQEYRYRKRTQQAFARNQPDVLMEAPRNMVRSGERFEPALDADDDAPARLELPADEAPIRAEPRAEVRSESRAAPAPQPVFARDEDDDGDALSESLLDPGIDFVAEVHARDHIPPRAVPPFAAPKRVQAIGLTTEGHWEAVSSASSAEYTELRVGLQLADRQGPLSAEQLNAFCMAVQQFADEHEAIATFPQRSGKLSAARELDEFCASVDVLIGLNLVGEGRPFPMEKVRQLAEQSGLVRTNEGWAYRSDSGKTLFTLANQEQKPLGNTSEALTLLFDVPRVAGGLAVFDYLSDFAQQLAGSLGANLVDDNGRALTAASLDNIRRQLGQLYARMDDRGIAPGSVAALRLFA